jgi:hypothetical protein
MIIKKEIEVGLDVSDPINLYSGDNIMYVVKSKYEKRCFKGAYIISVDKILRTSDCVINRESNDGSGTVAVVFLATVMMYSHGEIIVDCKISRIDPKSSIIIGTTDTAYVMLKRTNIFTSLKPGQYIPVQVGGMLYSPGSSSVAINAVPFLPEIATTRYICEEAVAPIEEFCGPLIAQVKQLEKSVDRTSKSWKALSGFISSWSVMPRVNTLDIFDLSIYKPGAVLSRGPNIDPVLPLVITYGDDATTNATATDYTLPANEVAHMLIYDYFNRLNMLNEMIKIYNTPAIINDHKNLFTIYASRKLDKTKK